MLLVLQCPKKPSWGDIQSLWQRKEWNQNCWGLQAAFVLKGHDWTYIGVYTSQSARMMSPSMMSLLGWISPKLCRQSWPVPVICWSSSSISPEKSFLCSSHCLALTEGPLHSTHITNSFLVYLLFINNSSLLALHCCFFLPRHAFVSEFDLCWVTSLKVSEENKRSFCCSVDGVGGWVNTAYNSTGMLSRLEVCEWWLAQPGWSSLFSLM